MQRTMTIPASYTASYTHTPLALALPLFLLELIYFTISLIIIIKTFWFYVDMQSLNYIILYININIKYININS